MRREGRFTGYMRDNNSTTELNSRVRVSNKPTNGSKDSGKCKRPRCRGCHTSPPHKAMAKAKGERNKAKGLDVVADTEWALHNNARRGQLKMALDDLHVHHDYYYDDDDEEVEILDPPAYGDQESEPNLEKFQDGLIQTHMRRRRRAWQDEIINAKQVGISIKQRNLDDNEEIAGHHLYKSEDEESQKDLIGESEENLRPHASDDDASSDWCHVVAFEVETQEEDEWYFC